MENETWIIRLRDNATGEVVEFTDEYGNPDGGVFIWEDGNYACDCNRSLFFCRAKGVPEFEDRKCGDEAYTVISICRENGELLYSELDYIDGETVPIPKKLQNQATRV